MEQLRSPRPTDSLNHLGRGDGRWPTNNWNRKDEGVWEVRGGKQHFLYSKVMCWVAVDRAIRLADKRSFPADRDRWLKVRDQIYEEILDKGWSNEKHAFFNITAAIRWTRRI